MVGRIILGLLITAVGFHMVWKTEAYLSFFGRSTFAEQHLGFEGGSRLFYKLIGVALCFLGVFIATNILQGMVISVFGPMFSSLE
ncbi:MAG: hypothetical protein AAB337_01060 [Patescibacteria group bacterium]